MSKTRDLAAVDIGVTVEAFDTTILKDADIGVSVRAYTAAAISTAFTITNGGLITWAHGLGAQPTKLSRYLKCLTAEDNWSIGDEQETGLNHSGAGTSRQHSMYADATNVYTRISNNGISGANKTTGAAIGFTSSRWEIYIRAEL